MAEANTSTEARGLANAIVADIRALAIRDTATLRAIRRRYSRRLKPASAEFVLELARILLKTQAYRWIAYELIRNHEAAFERLGDVELQELGKGLDSWWTVDEFARTLSGPAWLDGQASDAPFLGWARSADRWWRRAALVSTVALNVRSHGGTGDTPRTLRICRLLAKDPDEMVSKALSWALRALVAHDRAAVREFLRQYDRVLAARVRREVTNKLRTGLKNPRRRLPTA